MTRARNSRGKTRKPAYRRQRRDGYSDLAFVELGGRRYYLGPHGTEDSRREYRRLLVEWEAGGGELRSRGEGSALAAGANQTTIVEVVAAFWTHVEIYYRRPDGTATSEVGNFRRALGVLKELYGHTRAEDFGPRSLKAVRAYLVEEGLARNTVNSMVRRVRAAFKWAVEEEMVSPGVYHGLQAVAGLRRGRSKARETEPVRPVAEAHVEAVKPFVSRQVRALIELQQLTAARSGEILGLRTCDIDTSGRIWSYEPDKHKTAHHGHARTIWFGPQAQEILRPWMETRPTNAPLFSPREAERERREDLHRKRTTPLSAGNRPGTNRKPAPAREPGEEYTTVSYHRAIRRACEKANIPPWHPHQLRHSRATELRKEFGLEVARIILGHRSAAITEVYAEIDTAKAIEVMERVG